MMFMAAQSLEHAMSGLSVSATAQGVTDVRYAAREETTGPGVVSEDSAQKMEAEYHTSRLCRTNSTASPTAPNSGLLNGRR